MSKYRSLGLCVYVCGFMYVGCTRDEPAETGSSPTDMAMRGDMSPDVDSGPDTIDMAIDMAIDMEDVTPSDMSTMVACDCPRAPSPSCQDSNARKVYVSPGCDASGVCLGAGFTEVIEPCDQPPAAACMGMSLQQFDPLGTCSSGECTYASNESTCELPADECIDERNLRRFVGVPSCEAGACQADEVIEDCGDLGCCEDGCCALTPSNVDAYGEPRPTGIVTGPPSGQFNTDTECVMTAALGECLPVDSATSSDACVCFSDKLVINDLKITGSRALVLMASDTVEVVGTLDLSAEGYTSNGPGQVYTYTEESTSGYAAGGSMGSAGGRSPEQMLGSSVLSPLYGGCEGQSVCGVTQGGKAGGALQITASNKVTVSGTILANGGGGEGGDRGGPSCLDGAGGGSGGAILIEAAQVEVSGKILAQGGGGGGGGTTDYTGDKGRDGLRTVGSASGGSSQSDEACALYGSVSSGAGGRGATQNTSASDGGERDSETRCIGSGTYTGAGGGGGGVGYVRINTRRGAQSCQCGGEFAPAPGFGVVVFE